MIPSVLVSVAVVPEIDTFTVPPRVPVPYSCAQQLLPLMEALLTTVVPLVSVKGARTSKPVNVVPVTAALPPTVPEKVGLGTFPLNVPHKVAPLGLRD